MKKIRIGIPRSFLYYENNVFWRVFFENIDCKVILSPETNEEILKLSNNRINNECCLSYKIYIGHVIYLSKICDYILIPKVYNYGRKNYACPLFNITYDNLKQLIPRSQLLTYKIDYINYYYEFIEFIKLGFKFTKNPLKIIYSYILAKNKENII